MKATPPHLAPQRDGSERFVWLGAVLIAAATIAAYAGSFSGPWVFDDMGTIAGNPTIRHLGTALIPPENGLPVAGRPVLNLSFAVNYMISGLRVGSYHALNLAIHLGAALMLFGVARRTLLLAGRPAGRAAMLGFFMALLWAVHPLLTEAVTYLSQRAESLVGLFYLLTLYGFIRGVESEAIGVSVGTSGDGAAGGAKSDGMRPLAWFGLSWAACLLGIGTKEVMVTAPILVFLYDRSFVGGSFRSAWRARRKYYLALAATWILLAVLVTRAGNRGGTAGFGTSVVWWAYALTQFRAIAIYLKLAFWPHPLLADYGKMLGGPPLELAGEAAVVLGLLIGTGLLLWRRPRIGFLGAWFFLVLAPSSSVIPIATELIAERRAYLPLVAVIAALVWAVEAALDAGRAKRSASLVAGAGAVAVVVALAVTTFHRNEVYQSVYGFWADLVRKAPDNAGARNNLGHSLADRGRLDEAIVQFREALRLEPLYADAHTNLGAALLRQGKLEEAIANYRAALKFRPQDEEVRQGLGVACYQLGNALAGNGRYPEAATAYATAVEMRPEFVDAHVNYGGVLAELGRAPEAMNEFRAALRLEPAAADVHNNLGGLLAESGHLAEAKAEFAEALRLKPDYREARDNLERVEQMESARPGP